MPVNEPSYNVAVETSWDGVDLEEFEDFEQFASVHAWWNTENPETTEDVELPVAHMEDGQLKLVYEALNSAHDLAENAVGEENAADVRNMLENLREQEFPDREPLDNDENSISLDYVRSISEDEVSDCISEKVDEGWDKERAVAACLNMAEEGSFESEKSVDAMNPEEREERKQMLEENQVKLKTADLKVTGKDVEVVNKENTDGEVVVNVPIQALSEDRDGDFINEKGQESIIRQLSSGTVPLMLNHGVGSSAAMYDARDIVGQFVDGENRNGTTIGTARMRKSKDGEELHKDAKEIVDLLEQDMPIGFSVGFNPQEVDEKENGGMEISDLDLMEVSAVGIPSNPDAVPQAMSSAVAMAKNQGMENKEILSKIKSAFEHDTMTDKDGQSEQDTTEKTEEPEQVLTEKDVQNLKQIFADTIQESKSVELKQLTEDELDEVMGVVGGAAQGAEEDIIDGLEAELNLGDTEAETAGGIVEAVMQEMVDQVESEMEAMLEDEEPDKTDVTDEDEEDDDEEEMSGHTEDEDGEKSKSSEPEDDEDKEIEETEKQGYNGEPKKLDSDSEENENEEKSEKDEVDYSQVAANGEGWNTTV